MKKNQKTRRANTLFTLAALVVVLMSNVFVGRAQTNEFPDTVWTKFTYPNAINAVKFTPDGRYLASGGDDGVPRLWDAETGALIREFQGNQTPIFDLDINNSGDLIAIVNGSSIITIWNLNSGEIFKVIDQYDGQNTQREQGLSLKFSNNGEYLAAMLMHFGKSYPERDIFLWSTKDWSIISKKVDLPVTSSLVFSSDDKSIAVSNFVVDKGKITVCIMDVPNLNIIKILGNPSENGIEKSIFSKNNNYLASAIEVIPNKIWNTSDWSLKSEIGKDAISVAFSPDSKYVVFGMNEWNKAHVAIWDNKQNKETNKIFLDWLVKKYLNMNVGDNPKSIDISKNMNQIAVGGSIGIYMLNAKWNPTSIEEESIQILEPEIFPNPNDGKAIIRFNILRSSDISVDIFDINSRLISNIFKGQLNQGIQSFEWLAKVPNGIYFARISSGKTVSSIKIIVQR